MVHVVINLRVKKKKRRKVKQIILLVVSHMCELRFLIDNKTQFEYFKSLKS